MSEINKSPEKETAGKPVFRDVRFERHSGDGNITCYAGYLGVEKDESGRETGFSGWIEGFESHIWSRAETREELCRNLCIIIDLFNEKRMHDNPGKFANAAGKKLYNN